MNFLVEVTPLRNHGGKGFRKEAQTVGEFPRRSDRLNDQEDTNIIEKAKERVKHRDAIADANISSGSYNKTKISRPRTTISHR